MCQQYDGPEFMKPHFYPCPPELRASMPGHSVHQGIRCTCGGTRLQINKRMGLPAVFARCESCGSEFKVYSNGDYPAGYIPDDPGKPLMPIVCDNCKGQVFQVSVGYEYPGNETDSIDITWFTMVGRCLNCGTIQRLFEDETG